MPSDDSITLPVADNDDLTLAQGLRAAGEVVLFAGVIFAPWFFACDEPRYEFLLLALTALLALLWSAHALLTRCISFRPDIVSVSLAGIALWTGFQLIPLPESLVGLLSPARLEWHQFYLPATEELLPGETTAPARPTSLTLSVDPGATRTLLARILAVLVVYAVSRNWIASRHSVRRLAWLMAFNGLALTGLALLQLVSSERNMVYWDYPVPGDGVFGPFICRNHYPDYLALCMGLAGGLMLGGSQRQQRSSEMPISGRLLVLVPILGLMAGSIPLSLSRGGVLAVGAALAMAFFLRRMASTDSGGISRIGQLILATMAAVGLVALAWVGSEEVEKRFDSLKTRKAFDSRLPLWTDAARLVPQFWLVGTGGGTFPWVEQTVRTPGNAIVYTYYENAHNEFLEAIVEGGVPRLLGTVILTLGLLVVVGRGYLRRRERSIGPLLLGGWFGLAVAVIHAFGEFGIHVPAVTIATTVVAGFMMAAATDTAFVPPRIRVRKDRGGRVVSESFEPGEEPSTPVEVAELRGRAAFVIAALIAFAGLAPLVDGWTRYRADLFRQAAAVSFVSSPIEDRLAVRTELLQAQASLRPTDTQAVFDAAQARIDQAIEATWTPGAALAGTAAGFAGAPTRLSDHAVKTYLVPALHDLRIARRLNPLAPKPHTRFGLYAEYCSASEPAAVHFARAKRLLPADADIWFASGREAFQRGDQTVARQDWSTALSLSQDHLPAIIRLVKRTVPPEELLNGYLPPDPETIRNAADLLFPQRYEHAEDRRPFLEAVILHARKRDNPSVRDCAALARTLEELNRWPEALKAWQQAVALAPDNPAIRSGLASHLEAEEDYAEALEQLEQLRQTAPTFPALQDRMDAVKHGLKLQQILNPGTTPENSPAGPSP